MQFAKWRTYSGHKGGDFVVHEAGSWPSYEETFSADVRELATFQDFIEQQRHIFAETGILAYALVALGRQGREDVIPPGATITAAYMFRDIDPFGDIRGVGVRLEAKYNRGGQTIEGSAGVLVYECIGNAYCVTDDFMDEQAAAVAGIDDLLEAERRPDGRFPHLSANFMSIDVPS